MKYEKEEKEWPKDGDKYFRVHPMGAIEQAIYRGARPMCLHDAATGNMYRTDVEAYYKWRRLRGG